MLFAWCLMMLVYTVCDSIRCVMRCACVWCIVRLGVHVHGALCDLVWHVHGALFDSVEVWATSFSGSREYCTMCLKMMSEDGHIDFDKFFKWSKTNGA